MAMSAYTSDDLRVGMTIKDTAGNAVDLTSASFEVIATREGVVKWGAAEVNNAASGLMTAVFHDRLLTPGDWNMQVRVTKGTRTATVFATTIRVAQGAT